MQAGLMPEEDVRFRVLEIDLGRKQKPLSPMKVLFLLVLRRSFASKYTGRITSADSSGRAISVEVRAPDLPLDPRGHPLPRRHLVCRVSSILNSRGPHSDPLLDLSEYLQTLTLTLTPTELSLILKSLNSPSLALSFFNLAPSLGISHDYTTYNRILSILSRSPLADVIPSLVGGMERDGVMGSISTVNILIGAVGGPADIERCLELARKWGLRFNGYTYKCLVQAYLRGRDVERAYRVYGEMRRKGYMLDIFAYNMLIDALAKANMVYTLIKV